MLFASKLRQLCKASELCNLPDVIRLLNAGVDPKGKLETGRTPIHCAAAGGNTEIIARLIHAGVNINALDDDGIMPIHLASARGHVGAVRLLYSNGAIANQPDRKMGMTPLDIAFTCGQNDVIEFLTNL